MSLNGRIRGASSFWFCCLYVYPKGFYCLILFVSLLLLLVEAGFCVGDRWNPSVTRRLAVAYIGEEGGV